MQSSLEESSELHHLAAQLGNEELPPGWEIVRSSAYTRVACNPDRQVFYKEFLPRSPLDKFKALLRGSRARQARLHSDALLQAGITAPANLAWGRLNGGREYLFSRAVEGDDVTSWLVSLLPSGKAWARANRRQLLESLGTFIGRVHATGFIHGDLQPGNVLARHRGERFLFGLIDNECTVLKTPPPGRMLLRNLMQLNMLPPKVLSRSDRMRFFTAWHRQMRELDDMEAKLLAAEAYNWAMQRLYDKGQL
jgi:serine/threonine protein kinase